MKDYYNFEDRLGLEFEDNVCRRIETFVNNDGCFERSDRKADKEEGTDCKIYGLPVDITYKPISEKDHCLPLEGLSIQLDCGIVVRYGIRTGNNFGHTFVNPVLVISFACDSAWLRAMMEDIVSSIARYLDDIITIGEDAFCDYCEERGIKLQYAM